MHIELTVNYQLFSYAYKSLHLISTTNLIPNPKPKQTITKKIKCFF